MNLPEGFILCWQNKNKEEKLQNPHQPTKKPHLVSAPVNSEFLKKLYRSQGFILLASFPPSSLYSHCGVRSLWCFGQTEVSSPGSRFVHQTLLSCSHLPFAYWDPSVPPLGASPHITLSSPAAYHSFSPLAEPLLLAVFLSSGISAQMPKWIPREYCPPGTIWLPCQL